MGNWQLPPENGHMEHPSGVYYQTMNMTEINDRLKRMT
jgi:creatinine amidohydrolase